MPGGVRLKVRSGAVQKAAPGGDGDGGVTSKAALKTHPRGPNHTAAVRGELCFPHCRLPPCPGGLCQAGGGGGREGRRWGCRRSARSQLLPIDLRVASLCGSRVSLLVTAAAGGDGLGGTGLPLVS